MADNVTINPGTGGALIATDDVAGVQVQRVKIGTGSEGSYADVTPAAPLPVDGMTSEWRDEMTALPGTAGSGWQTPTVTGSVLYSIDGNAAGAGYLKVTLDPRDPTAQFDMIGAPVRALQAPYRLAWAVTLSRRSSFQHIWFGQVGLNVVGTPITDASTPASSTITGGVVINANVATVTTTTPHGLMVGQRVVVGGLADPRVNAFVFVTAIPTATSFTYGYTLANGTYGSAGTVTPIDASLGYQECIALIASDSTSGNGIALTRAQGATPWLTAWNPGSTWDQSSIPSNLVNYNASYVYPHQPRLVVETMHEKDHVTLNLFSVDSTSSVTNTMARDQLLPVANATGGFMPRLQARNLPHTPVPLRVTVAAKTGTTTATLTIPNHGLTTSDLVNIYGIRDQTSFPNSTSVQVASVVDANRITLTFGAAVTASSYGGIVARIQQNSAPAVILSSSAIQSIATSSTGRLLLTFLGNQGVWNIGESVCLVGLVDSTNTARSEYEGIYRLASSNTATFQVELDPMQGQALPGASIGVGGSFLPATDVRIHYVRAQAHTRLAVEVESGRAHGRAMSSLPVYVNGTPNINISNVGSSTANTLLGSNSSSRALSFSAIGPGSTNTDKASAVLAASTNSGPITDELGIAISGVVGVTAVSGTSPILDVVLQESFDGGSNWQDVFWLPRITATGNYPIPPITMFGRRRWNYILGGTSPSFTFQILVVRLAMPTPQILRHFADRAINPNTTPSVSSTFVVDQCSKFGLIVTSGAGATVAPVYGIQFSADNGSWTDSGLALTVPASSTVGASLAAPWPVRFARIAVKTAGTGATHNAAWLTATT